MMASVKVICIIYIGLMEVKGMLETGSVPNYQRINQSEIPKHIEFLMSSNCSQIDEKYFPLIKVQHSDEVHNSSFDLVESSDVVNEHSGFQFSITCVAPYPIEWSVNYFLNGYPKGNNYGLHLLIHRKVSNFKDPSTYKFTISSKMRYKNTHGFKNFSFSCQSVDRPSCLETTLYTSFDGGHDGKNGVKINIETAAGRENETLINDENEFIPGEKEENLSSAATGDLSSCDFKVYERNLGSNRYSLKCEFEDGTPGLVKVIHQCSNAISCMTFHQQHHQPLLPKKCAKPQSPPGNGSCPSCPERTFLLSQGFLTCVPVDDEDQHHRFHPDGKILFFFSSVPQQSLEHPSKLFFDMKDVTPSEMISVARINKKVSLGDQISVVCNTSSYYFASGVKFGVEYQGIQDLTYIKALANPGTENFPANIYEGNIPITTGAIRKIYCFAPTWNSFGWVNKSMSVQGAILSVEGLGRTAIAVSVTLLGTTFFCCLLFGLCWIKILRRKLSKFGKLLTPQEIDEFRQRSTIFENGKLQNDYENIKASLMNEEKADFSFLEIKREQLLLDETVILGTGHFGKVLKGVYQDEKTYEKMYVAVKTLKTKTDVGALKSLLSELKIMATVEKNLNVVNLLGACTKRMAQGEVYVAVEYCANGNLQNYLRGRRDKFQNQLQRDTLIVNTPYRIQSSMADDTILSLDLIKWAWEIAKGMEFLSSKKVIHGDLATRNILLTDEKVAKVSDFGLSRQLVDYYYVKEESGCGLPWKWMSIESLRDMKFSIQSDVWSYGVLVWEIFTLAEVPYIGCNWSAEFVLALDTGHRLGKPQYATSEMYDLMLACWRECPNERPSFFNIKHFFEEIITQCTLQEYMQLELCGNHKIEETPKTPYLALTPTIDIISDCEVEDDVFEQ